MKGLKYVNIQENVDIVDIVETSWKSIHSSKDMKYGQILKDRIYFERYEIYWKMSFMLTYTKLMKYMKWTKELKDDDRTVSVGVEKHWNTLKYVEI